MSTDVQPPTRATIEHRLERSRAQTVALHDEALEALRALDDWDEAQVAADDALEAAVNQVREAYWPEDSAVLLNFVVVGAERSWDSDGEQQTPVFVHGRGGSISTYEGLGLLDVAATRLRDHENGHPED